MVTAGDERLEVDTPHAPRRKRARAASVLVWLALSMIPHTQPARTICELAVASMCHFTSHTITTTAQLMAEEAARAATGFSPGVDELLAPVRTALRNGGDVTPRALLPASMCVARSCCDASSQPEAAT